MRPSERGYVSSRWRENGQGRPRRRRSTRWLIAGGMLIMAVWVTVITVQPSGDQIPRGYGAALIPLILATSLSPFSRQHWMTRRALERYDEFERAAIGSAALHAYNLFLLLSLGVGLVMASLDTLPPRSTLTAWLFATIVVGASLPTLIAEWTVPFPDAGDQPL